MLSFFFIKNKPIVFIKCQGFLTIIAQNTLAQFRNNINRESNTYVKYQRIYVRSARRHPTKSKRKHSMNYLVRTKKAFHSMK